MSLPAGVVNRSLVSAHPRVVGRLLTTTLTCLFAVLPLLVFVVVQVSNVKTRYEISQLERKIVDARFERRRLLADKARLTAPERLRAEAERLGLQPVDPAQSADGQLRTAAPAAGGTQ
ncbi:MAG: hypothetical protein ABFD84_06255 [Candidatus Polarisedimenticolia bacterium]